MNKENLKVKKIFLGYTVRDVYREERKSLKWEYQISVLFKADDGKKMSSWNQICKWRNDSARSEKHF